MIRLLGQNAGLLSNALEVGKRFFVDDRWPAAPCLPPGVSSASLRRAIEAVGAELRYLPAYPPDLNPIENVYAKLKSNLRKGAARTSPHSGGLSDAAARRLRHPSAPAA
jgi:DDE superfamily endonuclease